MAATEIVEEVSASLSETIHSVLTTYSTRSKLADSGLGDEDSGDEIVVIYEKDSPSNWTKPILTGPPTSLPTVKSEVPNDTVPEPMPVSCDQSSSYSSVANECSSSRKRDYQNISGDSRTTIEKYCKKMQEFDLRGVSDQYAESLQMVMICLEVLEQTKTSLTEISEELTAQQRLCVEASQLTNLSEIAELMEKADVDIHSMFGECPDSDFRRNWDIFEHCRSMLSKVKEQSFNRAAEALTQRKQVRNSNRECTIYFYPSQISANLAKNKRHWKNLDRYKMGSYEWDAHLDLTSGAAVIVLECIPGSAVKKCPKWTLHCKVALKVHHKLASDNGQYYYTEKTITKSYDANFGKPSKKSPAKLIFRMKPGLNFDEILVLENGWIDLHTRTMDIKIDIKVV